MNQIDKFFRKATKEFGESFYGTDFSKGFEGVIKFSEEHFIDCSITEDGEEIFDSYIDAKEEYMFDAFVEYVKTEIAKATEYLANIRATENYLTSAQW
ncbi:MAG: hypothetical protein ACRC8Z_10840 [Empedobacter falsenii]